MPSNPNEVRIPFDPDTEQMFCSRCGSKLEPSSHMFHEGLLCPLHGEFTIAPLVMRVPLKVLGGPPTFEMIPNPSPEAGKWFIHDDAQFEGMWETCKSIDERRQAKAAAAKASNEPVLPPDPRETRVL